MSKQKRYQSPTNPNLFLNPLHPKNEAQKQYLNTLREMTVTFCSGPAGTGKTYLAVYLALEALLAQDIRKIILTRPLVATEDIGYLPGDMNEKIHPYVMPLFDAVESHVGPTKARDLFSDNRLEVLPLAYMRGRSLNEAFLILDEAQNTTKEQIKMFLTRLGYDSKVVITGDVTQSDLPKHIDNGLGWAIDRLTGVNPKIGVVSFSSNDIVRNPLIETIIRHLDGPVGKRKLVEPMGFPALLGRTA
jgi:phosphate starvation-inducible PhoH-like protein